MSHCANISPGLVWLGSAPTVVRTSSGLQPLPYLNLKAEREMLKRAHYEAWKQTNYAIPVHCEMATLSILQDNL